MPGGAHENMKPWEPEEDQLILDMIESLGGKKWKQIVRSLPGRTESSIRNRWQRMEKGRKLIEEGELPRNRCHTCGAPRRGHSCPLRLAGGPQVQIKKTPLAAKPAVVSFADTGFKFRALPSNIIVEGSARSSFPTNIVVEGSPRAAWATNIVVEDSPRACARGETWELLNSKEQENLRLQEELQKLRAAVSEFSDTASVNTVVDGSTDTEQLVDSPPPTESEDAPSEADEDETAADEPALAQSSSFTFFGAHRMQDAPDLSPSTIPIPPPLVGTRSSRLSFSDVIQSSDFADIFAPLGLVPA